MTRAKFQPHANANPTVSTVSDSCQHKRVVFFFNFEEILLLYSSVKRATQIRPADCLVPVILVLGRSIRSSIVVTSFFLYSFYRTELLNDIIGVRYLFVSNSLKRFFSFPRFLLNIMYLLSQTERVKINRLHVEIKNLKSSLLTSAQNENQPCGQIIGSTRHNVTRLGYIELYSKAINFQTGF